MKFLYVALVAAAVSGWAGVASAAPVRVTNEAGDIVLEGEVVGYDSTLLRLRTEAGEVTVYRNDVTCEGPDCPDGEYLVSELRLSGAAWLVREVLPKLLQAFADTSDLELAHSSVSALKDVYTFSSKAGGSLLMRLTARAASVDESFQDLLAGRAELVLSTRPMRDKERGQAESNGLGDFTRAGQARVLGFDAIVPIVAPDHPISTLSMDQLAGVLAGRIRNWEQLGGESLPIVLNTPPLTTGTGQALVAQLLPEGPKPTKRVVPHRFPASLIASVRNDPAALGLVSIRGDLRDVQSLTITGECGLSIRPDTAMIRSGTYPLTEPVFLYVTEHRQRKLARNLLKFIRSEEAQPIMRALGYVDQMPEPVAEPSHIQPGAGRRLPRELRGLKWATTDFRYDAGQVQPDAVGLSTVQFLATLLAHGYFKDKKLVFVGFSDAEGEEDINLELARKRAEWVQHAVLSGASLQPPDDVTVEAISLGETLPIACETDRWGPGTNRRVELWIGPNSATK